MAEAVAGALLSPRYATDPTFDYTGIPKAEQDRLSSVYSRLREQVEQMLISQHGANRVPPDIIQSSSRSLVEQYQAILDQNRQVRLDKLANQLQAARRKEANARNAGRIQQAEKHAGFVGKYRQNLQEYQTLLNNQARKTDGSLWRPSVPDVTPQVRMTVGPRGASEKHFDYTGVTKKGKIALKGRYVQLQTAAKDELSSLYGLNIPEEARTNAEAQLRRDFEAEIAAKRQSQADARTEAARLRKELSNAKGRVRRMTSKPSWDTEEVARIEEEIRSLQKSLDRVIEQASSATKTFIAQGPDLIAQQAASWVKGWGPAVLSASRYMGRGGGGPVPAYLLRAP
ncbi:MAG: hypothetical protein M1823_004309 [Watsoniomyces obsoletus]|nr:MAG: hypothetical protein M1823_004309 [Watsoniomyces obsoletus]